MKESLITKIKRIFREWQINALKILIKRLVSWLDDLQYQSFMAFSWERDEITDYHVIAERSYEWGNVYGTRVTRYGDEGEEE